MQTNEHLVLCGGVEEPQVASEQSLRLALHGRSPNVRLQISDISRRLLANVPDVLADLLEVARAFSDHSGSYPELAKKLAHSVGVKSSMISAMASHRSSTVRAAAFLSRALSLAKACSMGLKSGE